MALRQEQAASLMNHHSMIDNSTSKPIRRWSRAAAVLGLLGLATSGVRAEPPLRCLWKPSRPMRVAPSAGRARVQYTQLFDDMFAAALPRALDTDRALLFRYERDWPDDHVFPNGVRMGQIHQWLTALFDAWNREPLMPVRLNLERGTSATKNVIRLDDDSSETTTNTGVGGYNLFFRDASTQFDCRAVINVTAGSVTRREPFEALAKHELGHCLTQSHSSSRASVMGYATGNVDYGASVGFFATDDLLGLRSAWARNAPGFGSLSGQLAYPDGSPVGGGDVVAWDDATGEVIATGVSDIAHEGRFRIELPAGRRVRLVAHPQHADAALFGEHFLPPELLTPGDFAPTEFRNGDSVAVFTVPNGSTTELPSLTVDAAADPPLLNQDGPVLALLPGGRGHLAMRFTGLGDAVEVRPTLRGLSVSHVTKVDDRVEFDVTAASDAIGVSALDIRGGAARSFQVGSVWVRPLAGLVRLTAVTPPTLSRGASTAVLLTGFGMERVTGVRVVMEGGATLPAQIVGAPSADGIKLQVTVPANAADGPWEVELQTAAGDAPRGPEPRPRLWTARGRLQAEPAVDLGDVPVGQPVELDVPITNRSSSTPYRVSSFRWYAWVGEIDAVTISDSPELGPGASGSLHLTLTPQHLGPTALTFLWLSDDQLDTTTEVRLWAVP